MTLQMFGIVEKIHTPNSNFLSVLFKVFKFCLCARGPAQIFACFILFQLHKGLIVFIESPGQVSS